MKKTICTIIIALFILLGASVFAFWKGLIPFTSSKVSASMPVQPEETLDSLPDHVHSYQSETTDPTCDQIGRIVFTCSCGDTYSEEIPALGHRFDSRKTVLATCTEEGYRIDYCIRCGYKEEIDRYAMIDHTYEDEIIEATCKSEGRTIHTCSVCGFSYEDNYTAALPHTIVHQHMEPSCSAKGYDGDVCSECGYAENETILQELGHTLSETVTAPNCGNDGYTRHSCGRCGYSYDDNIVSATGAHNFNDSITKETCGTDGYTAHTCSVCGYSYTDSLVPATGEHTNFALVYPPTCGAEGYTVTWCSVCGLEEKSNTVPATGEHTMVDLSVPATCKSDGFSGTGCSVCGYKEGGVTIPAAHNYMEDVVAPTDYTDGYVVTYCPYCDFYSIAPGEPATVQSLNGEGNRSARQDFASGIAAGIASNIAASSSSQVDQGYQIWSYLTTIYPQFNQGSDIYKYNFGAEAFSALYLGISACSGNCEAGALICQHLGIPYEHVNRGLWTHQWLRVCLDGEWYHLDGQDWISGFYKE